MEDDVMELDDVGDPVVHELDVVLSQALRDHLFLLQFPLRPASRSYCEANGNAPVIARLKTIAQLLELEVPIETESAGYDAVRGTEIGTAATSLPTPSTAAAGSTAAPGSQPVPPAPGKMHGRILASTAVPAKTHYAVAALRRGALLLRRESECSDEKRGYT